MACDICGKTGVTLETLRTEYQTKDICDICSKCLLEVNSELYRFKQLSRHRDCIYLKAHMLGMRRKAKEKQQ